MTDDELKELRIKHKVTYYRAFQSAKSLFSDQVGSRVISTFGVADAIMLAVIEDRELCAKIAEDCSFKPRCSCCASGADIIRGIDR